MLPPTRRRGRIRPFGGAGVHVFHSRLDMQQENLYWAQHRSDPCLAVPRHGIASRLDLLREHLAGRSVLHVGCATWPYTAALIADGTLLHSLLREWCGSLDGVDLSADAIAVMRAAGHEGLHVGDVYALDRHPGLLARKFDAIVITEVLEHLTNPGLALEAVRNLVAKTNPRCEVVFTAPNRHNFGMNARQAILCQEAVHFDHKFYFSYRTFRTLIECYGYRVREFSYVLYGARPASWTKKLLLGALSRTMPCVAPYLYFRCALDSGDGTGGKSPRPETSGEAPSAARAAQDPAVGQTPRGKR